jgi:thiol-disulfide isomerase/thioredoxin
MARAILLVVSVLAAGCGQSAVTSTSPPPSSPPAESAQSPASDVGLAIVDFDGITQHIERNRGKVVVMDAWSTSCPPCMKEFHNLVELHRRYPPEQLACISLSFDYEGLGKPADVQGPVLAFLRAQGARFDNLLSSEESDVLYRKFKLAAVPAVFVYDRAGRLRKRFDNEKAKSKADAFTYEQVGQLVAELLAEKPDDQKPAAPTPAPGP